MARVIEIAHVAVFLRVDARRDSTCSHTFRDASRENIDFVRRRKRKADVRGRHARLKERGRVSRVPDEDSRVDLGVDGGGDVGSNFDDRYVVAVVTEPCGDGRADRASP